MNLCAYPGCTNPARSNRENSTCSDAHKKNLWRIEHSEEISTYNRAHYRGTITEKKRMIPCGNRACDCLVEVSNRGVGNKNRRYCCEECRKAETKAQRADDKAAGIMRKPLTPEQAAAEKERKRIWWEAHKPAPKVREPKITGVCGNIECNKPLTNGRKYCDNVCGNRARHIADCKKRGLATKEPQSAGQGVAHIKRAAHVISREMSRMDLLVAASQLPDYNPRNPEPFIQMIREAQWK